jgi:hypothetical protein
MEHWYPSGGLVVSAGSKHAKHLTSNYIPYEAMKVHQNVSNLLLGSLLAAVCGLFTLAGCASMESASTESLLKSAGFQARTPSTSKQKAAYAALPAYQLHRGSMKGHSIYAYKDEKAGVVYLGNKAQYAQFKQLAANAKLKEEKQVAHNMDNDLVYHWYGSWKDFGDASPIDD